MYLFQDKKFQPNIIDGYRSAIADKLGISPVYVSKYENLTRLLDTFHRDRPNGQRGIPSWNLSLVILCYELSVQEALTLHQVKAYDVRAFPTSKAFQSGVSLEQILLACHWKSHNTLTQFYLKDAAWADSGLFHLGPVVCIAMVTRSW